MNARVVAGFEPSELTARGLRRDIAVAGQPSREAIAIAIAKGRLVETGRPVSEHVAARLPLQTPI